MPELPSPMPPLPSTLTGSVYDVSEHGLPGVTVSLTGPQPRSAVTFGDQGGFSFMGIPKGDYSVEFSLSGFQTQVRSVKIKSGEIVTLNPVTLSASD